MQFPYINYYPEMKNSNIILSVPKITIPCDGMLSLFFCIVLLGISSNLQGQSRAELKTLFFDGVYLDDPEEIFLSSSSRDSSQESISPTSASPLPLADQTPLSNYLDDIRDYEASINRIIESGGTFDPRLAQQYLSISELYQQSGDYENAVLALENTMHIERVNQGLYTLGQTEAVRKLIENSKESRDYAEADKYHAYLYYLMSRSLEAGSEEYTAAVLEWANWNMEAFRRLAFYNEEALAMSGGMSDIGSSMLRNGELVPVQDNLFNDILFVHRTSFITNSANMRSQSFTPDQLVDPRLKKAEELFDIALENNPDDENILFKKAELTYLFKLQMSKYINASPVGSNLTTSSNRGLRSVPFIRRGYTDSRESLLLRATDLEEEDPVKAAAAYINLADWDLAFDRLQSARQSYAKAHELLLANAYSEQQASDFITPEPAIFIPEFISFEDTRAFQNIPENIDIPYVGYLDVNFNKRSNGALRNIKIEDSSENTGPLVRNRLLDLLRSVIVRPTIENGIISAQSDIKMRFYYSY